MRIQHNIPAMSSYRNYTNNTSAVSKNLERLSSGYRINRAGDDAAGLAISEKMRAQITGLNVAQKNAKDGISLVKTAEGALQEVHDMLNRMVSLATQSANGTYDNETDRFQLQKEVNQLRSEINRIADSSNFNGIKLFDGTMEADKVEWKVAQYSDLGILTGKGSTNIAEANTSTIVHLDGMEAKKTKFYVDVDNVSFTSTAETKDAGISVGGTSITVVVAKDATVAGADLAAKLAASANGQTNGFAIGGVTYTVSSEGSKLVFEMTDAAFNKIKDNTGLKTKFTGNFNVAVVRGQAKPTAGTVNLATQIIEEGGPTINTILANTKLNTALTAANITDGKSIKVGDTTYVFTTEEETLSAVKEAGSNFKAIDISDIVNSTGVLDDNKAQHGSALSEALSRLTVAAKDNAMFTVGHEGQANGATNGVLTFQEKSTYDGGADLTTRDNVQKQIQTGTFSKVTTKAAAGTGKGLTLQIGDTADSYNQLKVSLQDMHCKTLGIDTVNIANQEDAASAIDAIKKAINTVSDVRGTLGATQNRLDHTINNLSVMTENIQDAESTIRDVDIAEEMMAYTKNNILVQSAQAMLAQANQIPQGVLQLLG